MTDSVLSSSSEVMNNVQAEECKCCCFEFLIENMVQCEEGHRFCFGCVLRQVEEIIYGSSKAHASLPCMHTDYNCKESIPLSEIRRVLRDDVIERYEQCQAREAVIEARLENLVYCPFCSIPCEVDKCVQVFDCPNPKCLMGSCIQCKEPSHIPLRCEEIEETSETAARRKIEERMTKAVIRECKTCNAEIVKMDGCNRVTCTRCRTTMCYVCRQAISSRYEHFCDHYYAREPGKPCQICKDDKCSLWGTEVEDNVALDAKEEALKEYGDKEPNLLDQKIGPPLVKQTVLEPSHRLQRLHILGHDVVNGDLQGNEDAHRAEFEGILEEIYGHRAELPEEQYNRQLPQVFDNQFENMAIWRVPVLYRAELEEEQHIQQVHRAELEEEQHIQQVHRAELEEEQHIQQVLALENMAIPLPVAPPEIGRADDDEDDGNQEHSAEDKVKAA